MSKACSDGRQKINNALAAIESIAQADVDSDSDDLQMKRLQKALDVIQRNRPLLVAAVDLRDALKTLASLIEAIRDDHAEKIDAALESACAALDKAEGEA